MIAFVRQALRPYLGPVKRRWRILFYQSLLRLPGGPDFYYFLQGCYRAEHRITLLAKLQHLLATPSTNSTEEGSKKTLQFRLRRNIHRLEKGLIMQPRRIPFAIDYISETVDLFLQLKQQRVQYNGIGNFGDVRSENATPSSLELWAEDVLTDYFSVVGNAVEVAECKKRFESSELPRCGQHGFAPHQLIPDGDLPSLRQFAALARTRKSVRWYQARTVPRNLIDSAVELAGLSPSACNRQPFRFIVFDRPEDAAIVGAVPMGTKGFAQNFPCVIVVLGDIGAYFDEKDRHVIYIDAGLASMSLQFALVSQGLGCCCINWPDIASQNRRIRQYVEMSETERVVMLISVGYPLKDGLVPFSAKKELGLIRSYVALGGNGEDAYSSLNSNDTDRQNKLVQS